MNNGNRQKLRCQIYYLENLGRDIDIIELDNILDEIERVKEEEENCFENLKDGLKEFETGIEIQDNIDVFIEMFEMVEKLREYSVNLNEAIEYIRESI
ncbi:hypothetical protein [Clostridium gasigenes]|uniref:Uncharacterized protein n=1 Tax=Clostridium gasigenes TaxID=94869 RepID=A0A1H0S2N9_9CLOT|nr:hypothetical protein [Clostridium gasigenes]SDP36003.1 hypothetical protein SAMN04488529_104134 [Clostridium gasigenes]